MSKWFYLNFFLLLLAIWKLVNHQLFPNIPIHIFVGFIGLLFILFNWTRHAVFSTIRSVPDRRTKIKFANISKKVLPFHRWIGTTALIIILLHMGIVFQKYGFNWKNLKMVSGLLSVTILVAVVTTGWMRFYRPSGRKRRAHLYLGLTMFFLIVLHVFLRF